MAVFNSCRPTAEEILQKYDSYTEFQHNKDDAHVYFNTSTHSIEYSLPLLSENEEYVDVLADRWFVANAENPEELLPVIMGQTTIVRNVLGKTMPTTYGHTILLKDIKKRFLLIGFKGITSSESVVAEIPPLFFIVENKKGTFTNLTATPRLAYDLFSTDYERTRFAAYSTLTLQKINLRVSNWFLSGLSSLVFVDEAGVEITVTNWNEWFENTKIKDENNRLSGGFSMSANKIVLEKDAKIQSDFEIDGRFYVVSFGEGTEFFTEKTADGKYILLLEETAKLPSSPVIKEK